MRRLIKLPQTPGVKRVPPLLHAVVDAVYRDKVVEQVDAVHSSIVVAKYLRNGHLKNSCTVITRDVNVSFFSERNVSFSFEK
jgi:hypothetical protein